jgi:hypothetical protein
MVEWLLVIGLNPKLRIRNPKSIVVGLSWLSGCMVIGLNPKSHIRNPK